MFFGIASFFCIVVREIKTLSILAYFVHISILCRKSHALYHNLQQLRRVFSLSMRPSEGHVRGNQVNNLFVSMSICMRKQYIDLAISTSTDE